MKKDTLPLVALMGFCAYLWVLSCFIFSTPDNAAPAAIEAAPVAHQQPAAPEVPAVVAAPIATAAPILQAKASAVPAPCVVAEATAWEDWDAAAPEAQAPVLALVPIPQGENKTLTMVVPAATVAPAIKKAKSKKASAKHKKGTKKALSDTKEVAVTPTPSATPVVVVVVKASAKAKDADVAKADKKAEGAPKDASGIKMGVTLKTEGELKNTKKGIKARLGSKAEVSFENTFFEKKDETGKATQSLVLETVVTAKEKNILDPVEGGMEFGVSKASLTFKSGEFTAMVGKSKSPLMQLKLAAGEELCPLYAPDIMGAILNWTPECAPCGTEGWLEAFSVTTIRTQDVRWGGVFGLETAGRIRINEDTTADAAVAVFLFPSQGAGIINPKLIINGEFCGKTVTAASEILAPIGFTGKKAPGFGFSVGLQAGDLDEDGNLKKEVGSWVATIKTQMQAASGKMGPMESSFELGVNYRWFEDVVLEASVGVDAKKGQKVEAKAKAVANWQVAENLTLKGGFEVIDVDGSLMPGLTIGACYQVAENLKLGLNVGLNGDSQSIGLSTEFKF